MGMGWCSCEVLNVQHFTRDAWEHDHGSGREMGDTEPIATSSKEASASMSYDIMSKLHNNVCIVHD